MGIHGTAEHCDYLTGYLGMSEDHPEVVAVQAEMDLEAWFFKAIANGNVDAVRYLLEVGMCADMISWNRGVRALSEACSAGHLDVAKLLRAHGARMIVRYEDEDEDEDTGVRGPSNEFLKHANGLTSDHPYHTFTVPPFAPHVREWVLSKPQAGDWLFFAAPPPAGRPPAADAAKWWPDTGWVELDRRGRRRAGDIELEVARYYTALRGSRRSEAQRFAPDNWIRLRMLVATRRIVLYWQEYTQARLCAPGGSQRAADEAAFKADLAPVIDQDQALMRPCAPGGPVRIADQAPSAANLAQVIARYDAAQAKKAVRAKSSRAWARFACKLNNKQQREGLGCSRTDRFPRWEDWARRAPYFPRISWDEMLTQIMLAFYREMMLDSSVSEDDAAEGAVMGKDKATWAELTPREVQAAATLGFDAIYWDNGMTPDAIAVPWSALQPPLRAAAMVLGYTATEWNEIGGYEELIPAASAAPAAAVGVAVGPKGKDKAEWSLLLPQEMQAATMLGFDAVQWDNGMTPETSAVPWSALQAPLRAAAQVLGYTAKEWNEEGGYEEEPAAAVPTTNAPPWCSTTREEAAEQWEDRTYVALASASAGPNKNADLCPIEWMCSETDGALRFGFRCGWLARAKAMQALRDQGVEVDDDTFPWPDRKYVQSSPV